MRILSPQRVSHFSIGVGCCLAFLVVPLALSAFAQTPSVGSNGVLSQAVVPDTTLIQLNINGQVFIDTDALLYSDGEVALPVKFVAQQLDILAQQAPGSGVIRFQDPNTKAWIEIDATGQRITIDGYSVNTPLHAPVSVGAGLVVPADVYVPISVLAQLLHVSLQFDTAQQAVMVQIDRPIQLLKKQHRSASLDDTSDSSFLTVLPDTKSGALERLGFVLNTNTFQQTQQVFDDSNTITSTRILNLSSALTTRAQGTFAKRPYLLEPQWAYLNGSFAMSDLIWQWQRNWPNSQLNVGSQYIGLSPLTTPFLPFWGASYTSKNALLPQIASSRTRRFSGKVDSSDKVVLEINGKVVDSQRPKNGEYVFDEISLQGVGRNEIQIYQGDSQDDSNQVVLDKRTLYYDPSLLEKGESAYTVFAGRTPLQFQPPGFGITKWLIDQSNKWVVGGRYYYGLSNRFTAGISAAADTVFGQPQSSAFGGLLNTLQTADLTGTINYGRDPNFWTGGNIATQMTYRLSPVLLLDANGAVSFKNQVGGTLLTNDHDLSLAGSAQLVYQKPSFRLTHKVYHYDTNYYTPMTLGSYLLYDRQGALIDFSGSWRKTRYQFGVDHILANLSDVLPGGEITANHWSWSLSRKLNPKTDASIRFNRVAGSNQERLLDNENTVISLSRLFPWGIVGSASLQRVNNRFVLSTFDTVDPFALLFIAEQTSMTNIVQTDLDIPLPKDIGSTRLTGTFSSSLSLVGIQGQYRWRQIRIEPLLQTSLYNTQDLLNLGCGLYYENKQGRRIGFRYLYTHTKIPTVATLLGKSETNAHQIQFDVSDAFAFLGRQLHSIGSQGDQTGILQGRVFLDLNQDGQWQKDEPPVPDVSVVLNEQTILKADAKGQFYQLNLFPGVHTLQFDYNELPVNFTPTTQPVKATIVAGRRTTVSFGIIVTPGQISGQVVLKSPGGDVLPATDLVVVILDKAQKEVKFTYCDATGHYILSDLPPGTFTVAVDDKQANTKHLKILTRPVTVTIPVDLKGFYEKNDLNFEVLQLMNGA